MEIYDKPKTIEEVPTPEIQRKNPKETTNEYETFLEIQEENLDHNP